MTSQVYTDKESLLLLSEEKIGLRKIHKDIVFPRIIGYLTDYINLKRNSISEEVEKEIWQGYLGWSCPSCGQWCYDSHNHNFCGRCGQKFLHNDK